MPTLIFIDTNIWLDFYRVSGRQGSLSILDRIDHHREVLISGTQVEMEFKKNRPKVILESHLSLKSPGWNTLQLPSYLARSKQSGGLETAKKTVEKQLRTLKSRTENIFRDPGRYDPVYRVAQRVFRSTGQYNLRRDQNERRKIRQLAWKRFILGYPPRKDGDTSIGDAVNWEWIVECSRVGNADVVIVSRDSDFGITFAGKPHLNDWLHQEFRERAGRQRKIHLTDRLTEAFRIASISVTREEEVSEDQFLEKREKQYRYALSPELLERMANLPRITLPPETLERLRTLGISMESLGKPMSELGGLFGSWDAATEQDPADDSSDSEESDVG